MNALRRAKMKATLPALSALALTLLSSASVAAQCALCRAGLEKTGAETAKAINLGIVVLLVPPVAIFCTIFAAAYRKAKGDEKD